MGLGLKEEVVISLDIEVYPDIDKEVWGFCLFVCLFFRCKNLYGQHHLGEHTKLAAEPKKERPGRGGRKYLTLGKYNPGTVTLTAMM